MSGSSGTGQGPTPGDPQSFETPADARNVEDAVDDLWDQGEVAAPPNGDAGAPPAAARPPRGRGSRGARWSPPRAAVAHRPRRRVAAAVLAAVVAGSGMTAWAVWPAAGPHLEAAPPPDASLLPPAGAGWVSDAQVALTSLDQQLGQVRDAEAQWNAVPTALRPPTPPPAVVALGQRKALLESERTVVASQLASYQTLTETSTALRTADTNLAQVSQALQASSPDAPVVRQQLTIQQQTLTGQVSSLRSQASRYQQDVAAAVTAPRPDPTDHTSPVAAAVMALAAHPVREPAPTPTGTTTPTQIEAGVLGRSPRSGDRSQRDAVSGAPPRPPSDGSTSHISPPMVGIFSGPSDTPSRRTAPSASPSPANVVGSDGGGHGTGDSVVAGSTGAPASTQSQPQPLTGVVSAHGDTATGATNPPTGTRSAGSSPSTSDHGGSVAVKAAVEVAPTRNSCTAG